MSRHGYYNELWQINSELQITIVRSGSNSEIVEALEGAYSSDRQKKEGWRSINSEFSGSVVSYEE